MEPGPPAGGETLVAIEERLRPRIGEQLVRARFRVEVTKVAEFARALLEEPSPAVPTTFYEAARLQVDGPDWSDVLDVDPRRMLHGEQEVRIHEPLLIRDEVDVSTVLDAVEPHTGRRGGDMLLLSLRSTFAAASGEIRVEAVRRVFLTSAAPTGRYLPHPDREAWAGRRPLRRLCLTDLVRYAGASGDLNPIHYDRDLARARGNPDVFAQGMLGAGTIAELARSVMPSAPRRLRFRFRDRIWLDRPLEIVWRPSDDGGEWTFVLRDDESDKIRASVSTSLAA